MTDTIHTDGLTKRYADTIAVEHLDLRVRAGEIYGFVGPNGAGKSTTIAMLLGLRRPTAGRLEVLGRTPHSSARVLRGRVGVLPEREGLFPRLRGTEHVRFVRDGLGADDRVETILGRVGLADAGTDRVGTYSKGMAQRLRLALALVGQPELLVLDEPAAGLDPAGNARLREIVEAEAARGATVFFSSHQLDDVAAVCDRVGFLIDGRLREVIDAFDSADVLARRFRGLVEGGQA